MLGFDAVTFVFLPQLPRVDDVLPHDIGGRAYRGDGVDIGEGHPNGKDGVFLPESLSAGDAVVVTLSDNLPQ